MRLKSSQTHQNYEDLKIDQHSAVCLGNFDGIHMGHQSILMTAMVETKRQNLASVLFTFKPHPAKVLRPGPSSIPLLFSYEDRHELFQQVGFDHILEQNFTVEFSKISADDFIQKVLLRSLKAKVIVVGQNFRFGHNAEGDISTLQKCTDLKVVAVPSLQVDERTVSSSWIRSLVQSGEMQKVSALLSYPYFQTGIVARGDQRGRRLGFPTANIILSSECAPHYGVYASIAEDLQTQTKFLSVTNIGLRPTIEKKTLNPLIETHLLNFSEDLYGRRLRIFLLKFLRSEKRFKNLDILTQAINDDVTKSIEFFESMNFLHSEEARSLTKSSTSVQQFHPFETLHKILNAGQ